MPNAPQAFAGLPAMCRVTATLKPSSDSDIKVEVWLPAAGWNGKLQGVGNGGWAGSIFYFMMANALRSGYAVVATDTGHAGGMGDGTFAFNHPEKLTDFAWRAVHEMTVTAKAVDRRRTTATHRAVVLERLLHRRPAGPEGSAALSRPTTTASSPARRPTT